MIEKESIFKALGKLHNIVFFEEIVLTTLEIKSNTDGYIQRGGRR